MLMSFRSNFLQVAREKPMRCCADTINFCLVRGCFTYPARLTAPAAFRRTRTSRSFSWLACPAGNAGERARERPRHGSALCPARSARACRPRSAPAGAGRKRRRADVPTRSHPIRRGCSILRGARSLGPASRPAVALLVHRPGRGRESDADAGGEQGTAGTGRRAKPARDSYPASSRLNCEGSKFKPETEP
jgi:hypothetical protein